MSLNARQLIHPFNGFGIHHAPGDLIFIRGTEGIAGTIKRLTNSPYTHMAGFATYHEIIESQALRRTGWDTASRYLDVADLYVCDTLSSDQRLAIVRYVIRQIGTGYDYLLIGRLGLQLMMGRESLRHNPRGKYICSTLWADAYQAAGIELCPGNPYPTPADVAASPHLRYVGPLAERKEFGQIGNNL